MARGCERAKVRNGSAGDKGAAAFGREAENVEQPAQRDLFEKGCCRSGAPESGVLVPSGRQPVGRDRNRKRAANDKPEESRPSHRHCSWRSNLIQEPQRFSRISLAIRQWFIERLELFDGGSCRSYRALANSFEITDRARRRVGKKFFVHHLGRQSVRAEENERSKIRQLI